MNISSLTIRHFRNYNDTTYTFQPGLNVIIGDNAAGKTNVLEAILFLAVLRSHRTHNARELIKRGTDALSIQGIFEDTDPLQLRCIVRKDGRKELWINERRCGKISELLGVIPVVWFSPEDLQLIKGEPDARRRWINMILVQTQPGYYETLKRYQRILTERNAALQQMRDRTISETLLDPWDEALAEESVKILQHRDAFINEMRPVAQDIHNRIGHSAEELSLLYKPSLDVRGTDNPYNAILSALHDRRTAEVMMGMTLIGPHRDDLELCLDGVSVRAFASQGQQRSVVLSLKLAEIAHLHAVRNVCPLGLFDDVLSELDDERSSGFWDYLLKGNVAGMQCIVSSVHLPGYVSSLTTPHIITVKKEGVRPSIESASDPAQKGITGGSSADSISVNTDSAAAGDYY